MAESNSPVVFHDSDIEHAVYQLLGDNFGSQMSRQHLSVMVINGVVKVSGHIASSIGYQLFMDNLANIDGVVAIDDETLYNDEDLRMEISSLLPKGLRVRISHGIVALSGYATPDTDINEVISSIAKVRGVASINTDSLHQ